ncbi:MAG: phosphodiesterase [Gammaproteobacteria bacterium]
MRKIALLTLLFVVTSAVAEVIHIPVGQQAPDLQDLPRPVRGMSTTQVLEQFGLPQSKTGPVGEPPISSWRYPAYTVYFESDTVVHSVLQHTPRVDVDAMEEAPGQ